MQHQQFWQWTENSAAGRDLIVRENAFFNAIGTELYGRLGVQLASNHRQTLQQSHVMNHFSIATHDADVIANLQQLPLKNNEIDAVTLPHTLDAYDHPQMILHEAHRILKPRGHLVLTNFNPYSIWAFSHLWNGKILPHRRQIISLQRMKDWLELLGFDIVRGQLMIYTPPVANEVWLKKLNAMDAIGNRWFPHFSAVYALVAVKRVFHVRPLENQAYAPHTALQTQWAGVGKISEKSTSAILKNAYNNAFCVSPEIKELS